MYVFILSYIHTKSSCCVAGIYVFVGTEFFYYVTNAVLYVNYRLQRLYLLGDYLSTECGLTGDFFGFQGFMLCQKRREMAMHV